LELLDRQGDQDTEYEEHEELLHRRSIEAGRRGHVATTV
jgi:hypothetical protein